MLRGPIKIIRIISSQAFSLISVKFLFEWTKISLNDTFPINQDLAIAPLAPRLKSRKPIRKEPFLTTDNFVYNIKDKCRV